MRASQHQRVDPFSDHWFEIALNGLVSQIVVEHSFLNQRDEQGTGSAAHTDMNVQRPKGVFVSPTANCRSRADHTDMAITRSGDGGVGAGLNHANDRNREGGPQFRDSDRRDRVAGHDNHLRVLPHKNFGELQTVSLDSLGAFVSVWDARRVAQVKNLLVWKKVTQSL